MNRWICRNYRLGIYLIEGIMMGNAIFFLRPRGIPLLTILFLMAAAAAPWILLYGSSVRRLIREAVVAMNMECDPEPLLELTRDCLHSLDPGGKKHGGNILRWKLNQSSALIGLGRYEEALQVLDEILPFLHGNNMEALLICRNNRASVLGFLGRTGEMEQEVRQIDEMMGRIRQDTPLFQASKLSLQRNRCDLRFLQEGGTPQVENLYQEILKEQNSTRNLVMAHLGVARCALSQGESHRAREHLRFVLDHGNKLIAHQVARNMLEQMEN